MTMVISNSDLTGHDMEEQNFRMWSTALELSDCDESASDDYKLAMLDAEADVVLEAIQLNMLSTSEEAQGGDSIEKKLA